MKQLFKRNENTERNSAVSTGVCPLESDRYIEAIERYLRYQKRCTEKTIFNVMPRIRRIVKTYNVIVPTDDDAIRIEEGQRKLGNSSKTICHFIDALRIMAEYNKVKLSIKKPRLTRREVGFLNASECRIMLDAARNPRDRALLAVLLYCGLRNTELRFLTCSSVNIKCQTIIVRDMGQGIKTRQERTVIMSPECTAYVKEWLETRPTTPGKEWLFVTIYGQQLTIEDTNKIVKRIAERVKIKKNVTAHMCRHSCASNMLKSGISVSEVALQLGHRSISTTTSFYLHGDYDSLRSQIDNKFIL